MIRTFECLHYLDNHSICILEICHVVTTHENEPGVFVWLLIDKKNSQVKPLRSKAIDLAHHQGERYFDLGYLKYDHTRGTFIEEFDASRHGLEVCSCDQVPQYILSLVQHWLLSTDLSDHSGRR